MIITETVVDVPEISEQVKFDAEKAREEWLDGLTEGEIIWAGQGLLHEGDQTEKTTVIILGLDGEEIEIKAEGLKIGENTLMVPSTSQAQSIHGRTRPGIKRNY